MVHEQKMIFELVHRSTSCTLRWWGHKNFEIFPSSLTLVQAIDSISSTNTSASYEPPGETSLPNILDSQLIHLYCLCLHQVIYAFRLTLYNIVFALSVIAPYMASYLASYIPSYLAWYMIRGMRFMEDTHHQQFQKWSIVFEISYHHSVLDGILLIILHSIIQA